MASLQNMILSGIIITRNEEKNIKDVIKNLKFCDEIIIVDNASDDNTVKLAKKSGAKVYSQKFSDFAQQRNYGLGKAKGEWILYVDADERITKSLEHEIISAISANPSHITHYTLPRKNYYFAKYEWPHVEKLERLFRKDKLKKWKGAIHESPIVQGKIGELDGYLKHYTHTALSSMVKKTNEWSEVEADLLYKSKHPNMAWWRFIRIMLTKFSDSYIKQNGWKAGTIGWVESIYQAFSYFIVYAKLWEKQND